MDAGRGNHNRKRFTIFLLCWLVYALAYFARVNISIVLPELQNVFGWSKAQIGLIGSGFFWVYGIGHLINGYLGDKVSGKWFIFIGTILIALSNVLFGFTTSLPLMVLIWSIHGFFQSMLWGPMIRILTNWFEEGSRGKVATAISTSMVGGYFLAWGLTGIIMSAWGWRYGVWVPGAVLLVYSFIWFFGIQDFPEQDHVFAENLGRGESKHHKMPLGSLIKETNLEYIIVACISKGIVKEGITLWGPLFIMERQGIDIRSTMWLILLIPVFNLLGILATGWMTEKTNNNDAAILSLLFVCAGLACYGLLIVEHSSAWVSVTLLGVASAMLHGANTILMGSIPMKYKKYNRTSAIAGILDSISYIAAGISVTISGFIVDSYGWGGVLIFWMISLVAGVGAMIKYGEVVKAGVALRIEKKKDLTV